MSLSDDMAVDAAAAPAPRVSLSADMQSNVPTAPTAGPDPTGSWYDNMAAGAGKAVVDLGRGTSQIVRSALEAAGKKGVADKLGLTTQADVDESKRLDDPLMKTGAGTAGYIGGGIAATMLPAGLAARAGMPLASAFLNPQTYTAAAGAGALQGALQPVGAGDNRGLNTLIGAGAGMAGNAAVNTIGRIAQPVQAAVDPIRQRAVQVLQQAGIPLDAAQTSGGTFVNRLRSSFSDNPFTAGAQSELMGRQKAAFNNAVLGTVGESGHAATPEVMNRADQRIGSVFKDVLDRNSIKVTDPFLSKVAAVQQAATDEEKPVVSNLANRLFSSIDETGAIPGQAAYNVKKDLDRLASSPDSTLAYHARQLRSTLMDGINDSLSPADQAAFSQARAQFRNLKRIEPAIDKEGAGNISPAILANTLSQKANRQASVYGRGDQDLVQLAQAGKMLLGDKTPNSGTTARAAMQLLAPLGASAAGGAYDAYTGDYGGALTKAGLAGGAAILAPKTAQYFINNPATAGYLTRGIQSMPLRSLLLAPQESDAVGGVLRRLPGAAVGANQ